MRQDLSRRSAVEEAIARLQTNATPPNQSNGVNASADGSEQEPNALKPENIAKLVQDEFAKATAEQVAQRNVEVVKNELVKAWGPEYTQKLEAKANELGVSKDWITETARSQPKALLAVIIGNTVNTQTAKSSDTLFNPSSAGISTAALSSATSGKLPDMETYAYWQKVRKDNPNHYHSVNGTKQRHEAAIKHGPAFYGT